MPSQPVVLLQGCALLQELAFGTLSSSGRKAAQTVAGWPSGLDLQMQVLLTAVGPCPSFLAPESWYLQILLSVYGYTPQRC